jgi:uncharacterized 2Fe-2S/4Fe-4S cluster protein (DUF4445 family)
MLARVEGEAGLRLLDALRVQGAPHGAPCGGRGSCGKCRVRVLGLTPPETLAPVSDAERVFLSASDLEAGWRLSCFASFAVRGAVTVEVEVIAVPLDASIAAQPGLRAGKRDTRPLRLAVDLGTTTIVGRFLDPWGGRSYGTAVRANSQRAWGADVLSRIEAAGDPAILARLRDSALEQIDEIIEELCMGAARVSSELGEIVVAGNTVMLHLLLGCDPSGMGRLPFTPQFLDERLLDASEAGLGRGLSLGTGCVLHLLPGISAFVGADLTAGILATRLYEAKAPELLVDLGTNGEIILSADRGLLCTATAAGPAFEGGRIEHGSPSLFGAVDHAAWNEVGALRLSTIGGDEPSSICGSGLLDLVAALREKGIVDETGRLEGGEDCADGQRRLFIDHGRSLSISQSDVREIQLAKGAVAAGIRVLCQEAGVAMEDIATLRLAGGFGSCLDPRSALAIGLIPGELRGRIAAEGNTSLRGTVEIACAPGAIDICHSFIAASRAIDLSRAPSFQDAFMDAMLFPEDEAIARLLAD